MGLFDIFKRRSKKAKQAEQQSVETSVNSKTSTEASSSSSNESVSTPTSSTPKEAVNTDSNHDSVSAEGQPVLESDVNRSEADKSSEHTNESSVLTSEDAQSSSSHRSEASSASQQADVSENVQSSVNNSSSHQSLSEPTEESDSATPVKEDSSSSEPTSESSANDAQAEVTQNEQSPVLDDSIKFEHGLAKSRSSFGQKLNALFANFRSVDDDFFDDLEDTLIESDVGFDMAVNLADQLRDEVKLRNVKKASEVQNVIVQKLIELYDQDGNNDTTIHFAEQGPTVIMFVGVNGVGKTTTVGKMANQYRQQGKKVLLAAADTFRAGAIQQLDVWAKRAHVDIVKKAEGSDPAAVVYEAVQKAKAENYDVLFVDTAGRLQNKVNLMNELAKMKKVLTREIPDAPHEVLLVLDATTGQNALNQAKLFKETTDVTGIVLTKLDGSARGGIILAIRSELHIPVKLVGLGEQINDLRPFNANDYVYGLFKGLLK